MNLKQILSTVSGLVLLGGAAGAVITLDARYAKDYEVQQVSSRLDQKILNDRIDRLQERIWKLDDRWRGKTMDSATWIEFQTLRFEKQKAEKELQRLK